MASGYWYGKAILNAFGGETEAEATMQTDFLTNAISVALFTDTYTLAQDTDEQYSALTGEVANGNGYTTGGIALANKTLGYTAGTNVIKFDGDDVQWTASSFTARYAVIYNSTHASKPLLGYVDFGSNQTCSNGNFTITWDSAGIFTITVS